MTQVNNPRPQWHDDMRDYVRTMEGLFPDGACLLLAVPDFNAPADKDHRPRFTDDFWPINLARILPIGEDGYMGPESKAAFEGAARDLLHRNFIDARRANLASLSVSTRAYNDHREFGTMAPNRGMLICPPLLTGLTLEEILLANEVDDLIEAASPYRKMHLCMGLANLEDLAAIEPAKAEHVRQTLAMLLYIRLAPTLAQGLEFVQHYAAERYIPLREPYISNLLPSRLKVCREQMHELEYRFKNETIRQQPELADLMAACSGPVSAIKDETMRRLSAATLELITRDHKPR